MNSWSFHSRVCHCFCHIIKLYTLWQICIHLYQQEFIILSSIKALTLSAPINTNQQFSITSGCIDLIKENLTTLQKSDLLMKSSLSVHLYSLVDHIGCLAWSCYGLLFMCILPQTHTVPYVYRIAHTCMVQYMCPMYTCMNLLINAISHTANFFNHHLWQPVAIPFLGIIIYGQKTLGLCRQ